MKNTRRDRFERVAVRRTNNILKQLKLLGKCSNKSSYKYDDNDIKKIFIQIDKVVKDTKKKFLDEEVKSFTL